jgi:hypothetical protein
MGKYLQPVEPPFTINGQSPNHVILQGMTQEIARVITWYLSNPNQLSGK